MALAQLNAVRKMFDRFRDTAERGDGELLTLYRTDRDQDAFGSLVRRHGPMVLGVCKRVLRDVHAADDAFQATFLVLAKKADSVRPPDRLAPWLYGVAYRTALKARGRAFRRQQVEQRYATEMTNRERSSPDEATDVQPIIDEQLNALPEKYRTPLVLCALQGLNKAEAAARLGLPEGTVSSRLARAREMLRDRLARRGFVVPLVALGAVLTADTLQAAVPPALAVSAAEVATGAALVPTTILTLSNEVLQSMILLKLKTLCAVVMSVTLAGGGFGVYAIRADEKKPAQPGEKPATQPVKPGEKPAVKPDGEKPKPANPDGEKPKPKPDGDKPRVSKTGGKVASVDAKENTLMLALKGDSGIVEKMVRVGADAKITIDGKEAKLADVPKNSTAALLLAPGKEGELPTATEVRVTGGSFNGVVAKVDNATIILEGDKAARAIKTTDDTRITVNGKAAKLADIKAGDKVAIVLKADESAALTVATGAKPEGEKPAKPVDKPARFGGKVASVDAATRTIMLAGKGEGGKEIPVKITADAKITIDGKDAKIGDIQKGVLATFNLSSAKDGQPRESNEVIVAGITFGGTIKQIDATSLTVGNEKTDRVMKLAPGGKVMIGEKEGKLADLKVGDRVSVTMTSDESAAVLVQSGVKKPTGDKEKPDKEDEDQ
jgi:RNA polymerase sigma factor (sigma-70 family)